MSCLKNKLALHIRLIASNHAAYLVTRVEQSNSKDRAVKIVFLAIKKTNNSWVFITYRHEFITLPFGMWVDTF